MHILARYLQVLRDYQIIEPYGEKLPYRRSALSGCPGHFSSCLDHNEIKVGGFWIESIQTKQ